MLTQQQGGRKCAEVRRTTLSVCGWFKERKGENETGA